MGYPMTWHRLVNRNHLTGDYQKPKKGFFGEDPTRRMIAGDMRRLEKDARDNNHLAYYSVRTGIPPEQIKDLFDLFFADISDLWIPPNREEFEKEYYALLDKLNNEWNMMDVVI